MGDGNRNLRFFVLDGTGMALDKDGFPIRVEEESLTCAENGDSEIQDRGACISPVKTAESCNGYQPPDNDLTFPSSAELKKVYTEAGQMVDDLVLKKYLSMLSDLDVKKMPEDLKDIGKIRFFRISEMVYQKDEPSLPKFASVFNAVQPLHCNIYLLAISDGVKTDFYMGIRSLDNQRTAKSLKDTLRNALSGQFPGVKTEEMDEQQINGIMEAIKNRKNIAAVSCVAQEKKLEQTDKNNFVQGLEKYVMAMQGHEYAMLVLAKSADSRQLAAVRNAYETIYTGLSPFASMQISYGLSEAETITQSLTSGISFTQGRSESDTSQWSKTRNQGESISEGRNDPDRGMNMLKTLAGSASFAASMLLAPLTGGVSAIAGMGLNFLVAGLTPGSSSFSHTRNYGESSTEGKSRTTGASEAVTHSKTETEGTSTQKSQSQTVQLTRQNKIIQNTLQRLDDQLKRLEQCESQGMWECSAYFLSGSQVSAEMAATNYLSLMSGENSGLETSAINFWPAEKRPGVNNAIHEYLMNFLHPVFLYRIGEATIPVTAASFVSGRELALLMGLPRASNRGFPVIEHAEFGLEALRHDISATRCTFPLGKIYSMGMQTPGDLLLDQESMTSHTFICGSTGSGKSNVVKSLLQELALNKKIPFLIIEPVKGEYKYAFHQQARVYGTNPQKFEHLFRINPFSFPKGIHVLEHLDRLVEVFNVAWPMYAAMPAVLKDAVERVYEAVGWDLETSTNTCGEVFPNFHDVLEQIGIVIESSSYSQETKGDYIGALSTRIRSLTTGLNHLLLSGEGLTDQQLFEENVIVDLSRVGSTETRALLMGLLIMRLTENRMATLTPDQTLRHITILEEAHNLLKRTSTEQGMEISNVLGKAVELLANSIAEMRAFGEAFIIVDQSPNMLDMATIRNTNTKIILRLPDQQDRELVGRAANLNEKQRDELARLGQGVAAVYQNDWIQPVLAQIKKFDGPHVPYNPNLAHIGQTSDLLVNLLNFALQILEPGELKFNLTNFSSSNLPFPKRVIVQLDALLKDYDFAVNHGLPMEISQMLIEEIILLCLENLAPGLVSRMKRILRASGDDRGNESWLITSLQKISPHISQRQIGALKNLLHMN